MRIVLARRYQRAWLLGVFFLHFALLLAVSVHDTLWLVGKRLTFLPSSFSNSATKAEKAVATALGKTLPSANPIHQSIATYLAIAGIQSGYGYFAPNVPKSYSIVFELQYPDGRVEYELPAVHSYAADLRVTSLIDEMVNTPHHALRERLIKRLALSVWHRHSGAEKMRAMLGAITFPGPGDFERGKKASYEFLYTYDFSLAPRDPKE